MHQVQIMLLTNNVLFNFKTVIRKKTKLNDKSTRESRAKGVCFPDFEFRVPSDINNHTALNDLFGSICQRWNQILRYFGP